MPNATKLANARPLPKATPHLDADLFTLAEKIVKADKLREQALDMLETAEERLVAVKTPAALVRTEEDGKMRLFIGNGVGDAYDREEIEAIGVLYRRLCREMANGGNIRTLKRCEEILEAWKNWNERKRLEEARSGFAAARRADVETEEAYEGVASLLIRTRALTVEGLFAKARAFASIRVIPDATKLTESIREGLNMFGVGDENSLALSLVRDVLTLARSEEVA